MALQLICTQRWQHWLHKDESATCPCTGHTCLWTSSKANHSTDTSRWSRSNLAHHPQNRYLHFLAVTMNESGTQKNLNLFIGKSTVARIAVTINAMCQYSDLLLNLWVPTPTVLAEYRLTLQDRNISNGCFPRTLPLRAFHSSAVHRRIWRDVF